MPEAPATPGWWTLQPEHQADEWHVVPIEDLIDHEPTDCACIPTTEPVKREDGSVGWVVTHHSLDGREQHE